MSLAFWRNFREWPVPRREPSPSPSTHPSTKNLDFIGILAKSRIALPQKAANFAIFNGLVGQANFD